MQLPMGWGVGEELTKSWPTLEQLCVQNLAQAILCCFFSCQESGWLEVDQAGPSVGYGLPTFDTDISVLKLLGVFLAEVLWQHPKFRYLGKPLRAP